MSRRLFRWTFNTPALISLLALLALIAACVHSRGRIDEVRYLDGNDKLSTLRVHHFEGQFYWLLNAKDLFSEFPPGIRPRRGWAITSHVIGSTETFGNSLRDVALFGASTDPGIDWGTTTVIYDWGVPKLPRFPKSDVGNPTELMAADESGLTNREFQLFTFPLWIPALFFAALPLAGAARYLSRTRWVKRRWESSTARRLSLKLRRKLSSAGSNISQAGDVLSRTRGGRAARRMMRLAISLAMVVCLLLSIAVAAMWVRSYWAWDWVNQERLNGVPSASLDSRRGHFAIMRRAARGPATQCLGWKVHSVDSTGQHPYMFVEWNAGVAGFHINWLTDHGERFRGIIFPDWALFVALLIPPAAWFAGTSRRRIRQRMLKGLCPACGFDLRASPTRCPECGTSRGAAAAPGFGWAGRFSIVAVGVLATAVPATIWWSNPLRGATPGLGADPEAGINFDPVWETPVGTGEERMHHIDKSWDIDWYQAIWRRSSRPEDDVMVVIQDTGGALFDENWRVLMLDRSMHVIREGQVGLTQRTNPYRLAEIRTGDEDFPKEYRGQWLLVVESMGHVPSQDPLESKPAKETYLSQGLVEWDKAPHDQKNTWREATDLQTRSAEPPGR